MSSAASAKSSASSIASRYPRSIALRDGRKLELRMMDRGDLDRVLAFARALPPDDLLFLRRNIAEADAVKEWIGEVERGESVTLLGFVAPMLLLSSRFATNAAITLG